MAKTKKESKRVGASPGTVVYVGEEKTAEVKIDIIDYSESKVTEKVAKKVEDCFPFKKTPTVTWLNVTGVHETDIVEKIGNYFGVHPLVLEDIANTNQRPKFEDFEDYLFIVLKMVYYKGNEIEEEQVSLILGPNFVISFQEREGDVFDPVRERIRNAKGKIRKTRSDYLAYALIDAIVDNYFIILEKIGDEIETLEEEVMENPNPGTLNPIYKLKRELAYLRKFIWPLREVISGMQRGESGLIKESTEVYLKDVYDHTIQVIDTIETYRDVVSGLIDLYLSSISNRMNEVMKVLTIFAAIFIPLTFIAGIYGMNFAYMPELQLRWAYPFVWLVIVAVVGTMLFYFRKKNWL